MFKIKSFMIVVSILAGLFICVITAFMTFVIIGTPIGFIMLMQIILTIISVLPFVIFMSYFFGNYLSKRFIQIKNRLHDINNEDFTFDNNKSFIIEVEDINQSMNFLSKRLNMLIGDLKQKNQNLSNLLISMAHDIKTPITILQGHIEEIEDGLVTKKQLPTVLVNMRKEINFLNELTVDMLEFISSMHNDKTKEKIALKRFFEYDIFPLLVCKPKVKMLNHISKDAYCLCNPTDLKKISLNILGNALKFTHEGHVKVRTHNDNIVFENTGECIPQKYHKKIFEPFFSVSKSKNRVQTGFGLGLSIVSNLALNNGYKCYVKFSNEEKTVFYFEKINSNNRV